jgi:hypothetical protein
MIDDCPRRYLGLDSLCNRAPYAAELDRLLRRDEVSSHDVVCGELLMGDTGGRTQLIPNYEQMHQAPAVPHRDVAEFVRPTSRPGDVGVVRLERMLLGVHVDAQDAVDHVDELDARMVVGP